MSEEPEKSEEPCDFRVKGGDIGSKMEIHDQKKPCL